MCVACLVPQGRPRLPRELATTASPLPWMCSRISNLAPTDFCVSRRRSRVRASSTPPISSGGLRPPDPLTRSLACRCAAALRSRGLVRCAHSPLYRRGDRIASLRSLPAHAVWRRSHPCGRRAQCRTRAGVGSGADRTIVTVADCRRNDDATCRWTFARRGRRVCRWRDGDGARDRSAYPNDDTAA
jgi:hypothetical protein